MSIIDWNAVSAFMAAVVPWPGLPKDAGYVNLHYSSTDSKTGALRKGSGWPFKSLDKFISKAKWATTTSFIKDIWFVHRSLGFDMNNFNLMFAFASELNDADQGPNTLTPTTTAQQLELYEILKKEFTGTELEDGLRRNWFDEFKPSYCTNAFNCGERFFLLQSDGSVYSCVRGSPQYSYCYRTRHSPHSS